MALGEMLATLRGFDQQASEWPGFFARLLGPGRGVLRLLWQYGQVRAQTDGIAARLQEPQTRLLIDIETLDRLHAAKLAHFKQLETHIAAADVRLREIDEVLLPRHGAAAEKGDLLAAQGPRDLRVFRDDLERRLHDVRLTRQVSLQSLPGIRLVQGNDKTLVGKIGSTLANTLLLWRQQLAQVVTIQRSRDVAAAVNATSDLTNELLRANAENLCQAKRETTRLMERGERRYRRRRFFHQTGDTARTRGSAPAGRKRWSGDPRFWPPTDTARGPPI